MKRAVLVVVGLYVLAVGLLPLSKFAADFIFAAALLWAAGVASVAVLRASLGEVRDGMKRRNGAGIAGERGRGRFPK